MSDKTQHNKDAVISGISGNIANSKNSSFEQLFEYVEKRKVEIDKHFEENNKHIENLLKDIETEKEFYRKFISENPSSSSSTVSVRRSDARSLLPEIVSQKKWPEWIQNALKENKLLSDDNTKIENNIGDGVVGNELESQQNIEYDNNSEDEGAITKQDEIVENERENADKKGVENPVVKILQVKINVDLPDDEIFHECMVELPNDDTEDKHVQLVSGISDPDLMNVANIALNKEIWLDNKKPLAEQKSDTESDDDFFDASDTVE